MIQRFSLPALMVTLALACSRETPEPSTMTATSDAARSPSPVDSPVNSPLEAGVSAAPDASLDTGPSGEAGPPVLSALRPASAARGTAVVLTITGADFSIDATAFFDGQAVPTTRTSDTSLAAHIPAERTAEAGFHSVWVETGAAGGRLRSNLIYLTVPAPPGWPEITDLHPDNGLPGDKIRIVGFNLTGEPLQITDGVGHKASGGLIGTVNSSGVVLESVEFTVPADWQSGPIAVSTSIGGFRGKVFNLGRNLALLPGASATASSEYGGEWTIARGADNDLYTSWFTAAGDCATAPAPTCKTVPWYKISFPGAQTVTRIAMRGNREYTSGYDFIRGRFEVLGENAAVIWSASYHLPEPDRDLDIVLGTPIPNATAVRFTSEKDESEDPGLGELEVF